MTFRLKFNLVLIVGFILTLAIITPVLNGIMNQAATRTAIAQAKLLNDFSQVTEHYNATEVAPQLLQGANVEFPPQSVPFYAVSRMGMLLKKHQPGLNVRVPALNPTNPADTPTASERDLIERLRSPSAPKFLFSDAINTSGAPTLLMATPIRVTNSGCLSCHSDPAVAPGTMIDTYGNHNGFGWRPNEIIGARIVTIPTAPLHAETTGKVRSVILILSALFLVILIVTNVVIEFALLRPLREMADLTTRVSRGDTLAPELPLKNSTELEPLVVAFTRMRRSLESAFNMLDE